MAFDSSSKDGPMSLTMLCMLVIQFTGISKNKHLICRNCSPKPIYIIMVLHARSSDQIFQYIDLQQELEGLKRKAFQESLYIYIYQER